MIPKEIYQSCFPTFLLLRGKVDGPSFCAKSSKEVVLTRPQNLYKLKSSPFREGPNDWWFTPPPPFFSMTMTKAFRQILSRLCTYVKSKTNVSYGHWQAAPTQVLICLQFVTLVLYQCDIWIAGLSPSVKGHVYDGLDVMIFPTSSSLTTCSDFPRGPTRLIKIPLKFSIKFSYLRPHPITTVLSHLVHRKFSILLFSPEGAHSIHYTQIL